MKTPNTISGIIPELAHVSDFGPPRSEIGIGALMPWNGKLYSISYVSHGEETGRGNGLRVIEPDFSMTLHPEAIDGTFINRFIHWESQQLIMGPHFIDSDHNVRTIKEFKQYRLAGTAKHLEDPDNMIYMLCMEGGLWEVNVHTLEWNQITNLVRHLPVRDGSYAHFKNLWSDGQRLTVVNNSYDRMEYEGIEQNGFLAEGSGTDWKVIDNNPHLEVVGRFDQKRGEHIIGVPTVATGWDRSSAILNARTQSDGKWTRYRLPKASHCFDQMYATEWTRIREVEHDRWLMDLHGMFYELPARGAYHNRVWGIKPISQHLGMFVDFCSWRGMLVMAGDGASPLGGKNPLVAEPQSGLWFGKTDDLWNFGKPQGWGGPWYRHEVKAGVPSDPYLMTGFDKKCLHLSHDLEKAMMFSLEVDFHGDGDFKKLEEIEVAGGMCTSKNFEPGFSAHWVRLIPHESCVASAQFFYT